MLGEKRGDFFSDVILTARGRAVDDGRASHASRHRKFARPQCGTVRLDGGSTGWESVECVPRILPYLPVPAMVPPSGTGWIHEIKHDGFRLMARREPVGIRLIKWTPSERQDVGTGSRQR
jgi:hypothetical protein